jgi:hypothetical protein
MKVRHDSFCGLNCGACPIGLANERDDTATLARLAQEWGVDPSLLVCAGCRGDVTIPFCARCEMRKCATSRAHDFCFQCSVFPCESMTSFRNDDMPHHSVVFQNLRRISGMGVEKWLQEENDRWSCPACSRRFSWYETVCASCGGPLHDAVAEEKQLVDQDTAGH